MAVRALKLLSKCLFHKFYVASGQAVTAGQRVKFASSDTEVQNCGANEAGIGTAVDTAVAGAPVEIMLDGHAVVPITVGTGGATRGLYAKSTANGYADQAIADGTTPRFIAGMFMQSGVAGDVIGMMVGIPTPLSTA